MSSVVPIASSSAPGPEPTRIAGRFLLLEKLGAGGMGAVHRARDEASGRIVAFKQLSSSLAGSKRRTLEALFEREYHTLVRLKHPRIIEVYDYGLTESGPYYTMELLDGQDLQQLAPMPYRDACRYLRDVASSLALIHAHRLLHRDVSPRNVRLTKDGRAKLIDFGALTAFGPAANVVGTPLCMAPEILRRMPLDQRTDLYALGTVAYWALTGQHAYPARRFDELPRLWQKPPQSPAKLNPEIPPALDGLIMSLLSLDLLARPASAAAVIDQLNAVAELEPEEQHHDAQSYLSSGRMVGRKGEEAWVEKRVARALTGKGGELVIEGPAGIGKTRLLHELGLLAQLKGATVLKADAQAVPGFFGVAAALGSNLLAAFPELARSAAAPHAELLAHLSPELKDRLEQSELVKLTADPNERRARFQGALHEWFLELARERTLVLAVDNLQAADDNSAAFLAALGSRARETNLMLLVTQRSGDPVVAKAPVHALRKRCSRLKLAGLSTAACEELVSSLFGDVANTGRVARLLYEKSAGNPQLCMDLAQLLVKKQIARYAGGTWVLPLDVSAAELPSRVEEVLAAKLEGLSAQARALAEGLCIHVKPVPIELCLSTGAGRDESAALSALDELVAEQILLIEGSSYRFAQEALREALLAQMDEQKRRDQHRRAAEALLGSAGESLDLRMEAGWHLLRAGQEQRGADLLASTTRGYLKTQGANESVDHIVKALRAAIEVYERHGRSDHEIAGLLFPMVPLSYFTPDFRLVQRSGLRALQLGLKITGLSLAHKLRWLLGDKLALKLGLFIGGLGFARARKRGLDYDLREAIASCCGMVPATTAAFSTLLDARGVAQVRRVIDPLRLFDPDQFPRLMYDWAELTTQMARGLAHEAHRGYALLIERFLDPRVRKVLGEGHFKSMYGGLLFAHAVTSCYGSMTSALERAREMEALGVRTWAMGADQIRTFYHAYRGEIEEVQRYRAKVELFAVQGSATWQSELFLPALLLNADVLTGDTIAARRSWEQLSRRAEEVPTLKAYADAAHAAYLALRGELSAAVECYERVLPEFPLRGRVLWLAVRGYFAQALNLAGAHARARQLLVEALAQADPDDAMVALTLESHRQLALAESGLGNHERAVQQLDALLAKYGSHDNPLLVGLLHKARAEVALAMRDRAGFETHFADMERRFRATRNPALIAQWEQLAQRAGRAGLRASIEPRPERADAASWVKQPAVSGHRSVAELTAAADRAEYALWLILERTRAKTGYLYLVEKKGWRLAAASSPNEPPASLEAQLRQLSEESQIDSLAEEETGTVVQIPGSGALSDSISSGGDSALRSSARPIGQQDDLATIVQRPSVIAAALAGPSLPAEEIDKTVFIESVPAPGKDKVYRLLVLRAPRPLPRVAVGGVILEVGAQELRGVDPELIDGVARALQERYVTTAAESPLTRDDS